MDYIDLILLLFSALTCLFTAFYIEYIAMKSPIMNLYSLLALTILFLGINFLMDIPLLFLDSTTLNSLNVNHQTLVLLLRISHIFALMFVLLFTILIYLPLLTLDLKSLGLIIISTFFSTTSLIIDSFTLNFIIVGTDFRIVYNPLGILALVFSLSLMLYVLVYRYNEFTKALKTSTLENKPNTVNQTQDKKIFYWLIALVVITFFFGREFDIFPDFFWTIFVSFGLIFLVYALSKNNAFFFQSTSKLEGVVILNSSSGKVQYYNNNQNVDVLLTGVVSAFNISIKQLVSSTTDIQQIILQDKSILLAKEKYTTTLLLVSKKTIISDFITRYIAKKFEKSFKKLLTSSPDGIDNLANFKGFDKEILKITNYFRY